MEQGNAKEDRGVGTEAAGRTMGPGPGEQPGHPSRSQAEIAAGSGGGMIKRDKNGGQQAGRLGREVLQDEGLVFF